MRAFSRHVSSVGPLCFYGPLTRYEKLGVAHAPGMPGTSFPPPQIRDPDMHHGTCVTHVPWCMPGSLNCVFLWSWWRGKRSRHSRRMRNPQFYVSGKRPMRSMAYGNTRHKSRSVNFELTFLVFRMMHWISKYGMNIKDFRIHYRDVVMTSAMASQITGVSMVCSTI